jgi:hypothetical protein
VDQVYWIFLLQSYRGGGGGGFGGGSSVEDLAAEVVDSVVDLAAELLRRWISGSCKKIHYNNKKAAIAAFFYDYKLFHLLTKTSL